MKKNGYSIKVFNFNDSYELILKDFINNLNRITFDNQVNFEKCILSDTGKYIILLDVYSFNQKNAIIEFLKFSKVKTNIDYLCEKAIFYY